MAARDKTTAKNRNRKIRQDNLRESLAAGGHIQHVLDISDKLLDVDNELDSVQVTRLKSAADIKLKLIDKYLPGLKQVELSGGITVDDIRDKTDEELQAIIGGS